MTNRLPPKKKHLQKKLKKHSPKILNGFLEITNYILLLCKRLKMDKAQKVSYAEEFSHSRVTC